MTQSELNVMFWEFQLYMTPERWDSLDVYEGDGLEAVSAFIEFCCTGKVSNEEMEEL